ncbi:hypothetical protein BDY19DRAFT_996924 [Irpex rosettiformis]|uniref:Uncharacterized protein n=1 Tax=Irpex rosettiformis TaxID=378272 RepID=A0ACB8TT86_9APHY|nr:hypothetical protein BDY19DRAFT_996924 [Irpex rosettiformis]
MAAQDARVLSPVFQNLMSRVLTILHVSPASLVGLPASLAQADGTIRFVSKPFPDQKMAELHALNRQIQEADHETDGNVVFFPSAVHFPVLAHEFPTFDNLTVVKGWRILHSELMYIPKGRGHSECIIPVAWVERHVLVGDGRYIDSTIHPEGWTMLVARGSSEYSTVEVCHGGPRRRDRDDEGAVKVRVKDGARGDRHGRVLMDDLLDHLDAIREADAHEVARVLHETHGLVCLPPTPPSSSNSSNPSDAPQRPLRCSPIPLVTFKKPVRTTCEREVQWPTSPTPWDNPKPTSPHAALMKWGSVSEILMHDLYWCWTDGEELTRRLQPLNEHDDSDHDSMPSLMTISDSSSGDDHSSSGDDDDSKNNVQGRICKEKDDHSTNAGRGRSLRPQPLDRVPSPQRTASAPPALHSPRSLLSGDGPSSPEVSTPAMWEVLNDAAEALGSHFPPQQLSDAISNLATLCGLDSAPCPSPVDSPQRGTITEPTVKRETEDSSVTANVDNARTSHDPLVGYCATTDPPPTSPSSQFNSQGVRPYNMDDIGDWWSGYKADDEAWGLDIAKEPAQRPDDDLAGDGIRVAAVDPPASPSSASSLDYSDLTGLYDPLRIDTSFATLNRANDDVPMPDRSACSDVTPPPMQADYSFTPSLATVNAVEGILSGMKGTAGFGTAPAVRRPRTATQRLVFPTPDAVMEAYANGGPPPPRQFASIWMARRTMLRVLRPLLDRAYEQGLMEFLDKYNRTVVSDAYGEMALATLFFPKGCYDGCPYLDPVEELEALQARLFFGVTNPFLEQHSIAAIDHALSMRTPWPETQYIVYLRTNGFLGGDWSVPAHGFQPAVARYSSLRC